jgi:hypothetical protein
MRMGFLIYMRKCANIQPPTTYIFLRNYEVITRHSGIIKNLKGQCHAIFYLWLFHLQFKVHPGVNNTDKRTNVLTEVLFTHFWIEVYAYRLIDTQFQM